MRAAARHWAGGRGADRDKYESQLDEWGFTDAQKADLADEYDGVEAEMTFGVWRENWATLEVFCGCQTQWRHAGMAGMRTGLDYCAVEAVVRMTGRGAHAAELLDGVRVMEHAALEVFAEQAEMNKRRTKQSGRRR